MITGPTSQVALPVVEALTKRNQVFGLARFRKKADREKIEALGATTLAIDLADGALDEVPQDFSIVLHFAVVKSGDFDYDLAANADRRSYQHRHHISGALAGSNRNLSVGDA